MRPISPSSYEAVYVHEQPANFNILGNPIFYDTGVYETKQCFLRVAILM